MEYVKKFNQWADYKGKFKGKLLTPMEFAQFGVKGRDLIMSNRTYYKEFCQYDHMKQDKEFQHYLTTFVTTNPLIDKGYSENRCFIDIYTKLKYITLNDYFSVKEQSHKQTCTTSGNRLTDWELRRVKIHLKDYINWIKNKDEIMEQWEEDAELFQIEREELEDYYESYSYGEYEDELPF